MCRVLMDRGGGERAKKGQPTGRTVSDGYNKVRGIARGADQTTD
ncbi:MAG: hypothetical protein AAF985_14215 [Bacteroidota bacterium]